MPWLHSILRIPYRLSRLLPVSPHKRRAIRNWCFQHAGWLFKHTSAYHYWLQYPDSLPEEEAIPQPGSWETVFARFYAPALSADTPPAMLFISHDQGGGTEAHVRALAAEVEAAGWRSLSLRSTWSRVKGTHPPLSDQYDTRPPWVRISPFESHACQQLVFDPAKEKAGMIAAVKQLGIKHIHLHHTLDMPDSMLELLPELCREADIHYDFTAHDYFSLCPRFSLFDEGIRAWCGEPTTDKCDLCIRSYGSVAGRDFHVADWRLRAKTLLSGARRIFTPSQDVADRLGGYYPELAFTVRSHPEAPVTDVPDPIARTPDMPLRVVMLGAIAPYKGSQVMRDVARYAYERELPIHFTIIGHTDIDAELKHLPNMTITGGYRPDALPRMLAEGQFHCAWFCNVIPETYSYTLSETLRAGITPLAFDIGAIGERIRTLGWGSLLPLHEYRNPEAITQAMLTLPITPPPLERLQAQFTQYSPFLETYYGLGGRS